MITYNNLLRYKPVISNTTWVKTIIEIQNILTFHVFKFDFSLSASKRLYLLVLNSKSTKLNYKYYLK
jgi:hypothetical protein